MSGNQSRVLCEILAKFFATILLFEPLPFRFAGILLWGLRGPFPQERPGAWVAPRWIALRESLLLVAAAMGLLVAPGLGGLALAWVSLPLAIGFQLAAAGALGEYWPRDLSGAVDRSGLVNLLAWFLLGGILGGFLPGLDRDQSLVFLLAAIGASLLPLWAAKWNGEPGLLPFGAFCLAAGMAAGRPELAGIGVGWLLAPGWTLCFHRRFAVAARSWALALGAVAGAVLSFQAPAWAWPMLGCLLFLLALAAWRMAFRFLLFVILRSLYTFRLFGKENIPARGAAMVVANHVSFPDGFILAAYTQRHVRFLVYDVYFQQPLLRFALLLLRAIPIAQGAKREAVDSLRAARAEIERGHVAGVFPEGALCRNGYLNPFQKGFTRVIHGSEIPLIPAYLNGLWCGFLTLSEGRFRLPVPRFYRRVEIEYGKPLPATSTAGELWRAVKHLETRAAFRDALRLGTVGERFLATAVRNWSRPAIVSAQGTRTYGDLAMEAIIVSAQLRRRFARKERVLVAEGDSALRIALAMAGHVALPVGQGGETVGRLERTPDGQDRLALRLLSMVSSRLLYAKAEPHRTLPDQALAILDGRERSVVVSHRGTLAAVDQIRRTLWIRPGMRVRNRLPLRRAAGALLGFWLPLLEGATLVETEEPVDFEIVAPGDPTAECRHRVVVYRAGEALAEAEKNELACLELPELSGVLALSTPEVTIWGDTQSGIKAGTFGKLPFGVEATNTEAGLRLASPARFLHYLDDGLTARDFRLDRPFVLPLPLVISDQGFVAPEATSLPNT